MLPLPVLLTSVAYADGRVIVAGGVAYQRLKHLSRVVASGGNVEETLNTDPCIGSPSVLKTCLLYAGRLRVTDGVD